MFNSPAPVQRSKLYIVVGVGKPARARVQRFNLAALTLRIAQLCAAAFGPGSTGAYHALANQRPLLAGNPAFRRVAPALKLAGDGELVALAGLRENGGRTAERQQAQEPGSPFALSRVSTSTAIVQAAMSPPFPVWRSCAFLQARPRTDANACEPVLLMGCFPC